MTNIFGLGTIHNCLSYRGFTLKKEILSETISVLPSEDGKDLKDGVFLEIAVQEVKNVSSRVATATSPSYDTREDRGHVGGCLNVALIMSFITMGKKRKRQ